MPRVFAYSLSKLLILKPFNPNKTIQRVENEIIIKFKVGSGIPKTLGTMGTVLMSPNKTQSTSISAFFAFDVISMIPTAKSKV